MTAGTAAAPLTGSGRLSLRDGTVSGFDLDALAALQSDVEKGAELARLVAQDLSRGKTAVAALDGSFTLQGGRLATDDMTSRATAGTIALRGGVDLAAGQLDLQLALQLAGAPPARIHVTGALAAPVRALDAQDLVAFLAAARRPAAATGSSGR